MPRDHVLFISGYVAKLFVGLLRLGPCDVREMNSISRHTSMRQITLTSSSKRLMQNAQLMGNQIGDDAMRICFNYSI